MWCDVSLIWFLFFFFKQKTAYEMRISDWSSDVCSSDLVASYLIEMGRDTLENWQSEFLQLLWQVVGLAYFLYVGSPASKENDDRLEAKVDELIRITGRDRADALIEEIDRRYLRKAGHAKPPEIGRAHG